MSDGLKKIAKCLEHFMDNVEIVDDVVVCKKCKQKPYSKKCNCFEGYFKRLTK